MADEKDEELLLTDELVDQDDGDAQTRDADPDIEIPTFADEGEEQDADTDLVKHLRSQLREEQKARKEAEQGSKPKPAIEVGDEPEWGDWGEAYDGDIKKFNAERDAWKRRKDDADAAAGEGEKAERKRAEEIQGLVQGYQSKKAAIQFEGKEDAEATTFAALSDPQKEILLRIAADPAKLVIALGRNTSKLAALASVKVADMVGVAQFAAAVAKIDGELKMAKRRPTAQPDRPVRGAAPLTQKVADKDMDKALDKGDFSEYRRLRKERDKAAAA